LVIDHGKDKPMKEIARCVLRDIAHRNKPQQTLDMLKRSKANLLNLDE